VEGRSRHADPKEQLGEQQKHNVTEAVGRVWESCDELVALADGGIGAFIVKKAEMWLGLIKDAVEELGEWDPEEDGVDGLFGEDMPQNDHAGGEAEEVSSAAEITKASVMRVLTRVPQSLHVVVKQRLRKWEWESPSSRDLFDGKASETGGASSSDHEHLLLDQYVTADYVLKGIQEVSETVDEMAEALYMGQLGRSGKLVNDVWRVTVDVVAAVRNPNKYHTTHGSGIDIAEEQKETSEDKYIRRALDWIKLVEPKPPNSRAVTNESQH
jgi:Grap2 and cyclin-D-interacting